MPPADATKQERARARGARARLSLGEWGRRAGLPEGGDGVHAICWAVPVCGRRARESGRGEMARSPPHRFRFEFGGGGSGRDEGRDERGFGYLVRALERSEAMGCVLGNGRDVPNIARPGGAGDASTEWAGKRGQVST